MPDAVGPDEGDDRHAALGQPAGVLDRGGRRLEIVRDESVFEHVQERGHVLLDAGIEQLLDDVVAAEFRDVAGQQQPDVVAEVEELPSRGRPHGGQLAFRGVAPAVHQVIVVMQPSHVHQTRHGALSSALQSCP